MLKKLHERSAIPQTLQVEFETLRCKDARKSAMLQPRLVGKQVTLRAVKQWAMLQHVSSTMAEGSVFACPAKAVVVQDLAATLSAPLSKRARRSEEARLKKPLLFHVHNQSQKHFKHKHLLFSQWESGAKVLRHIDSPKHRSRQIVILKYILRSRCSLQVLEKCALNKLQNNLVHVSIIFDLRLPRLLPPNNTQVKPGQRWLAVIFRETRLTCYRPYIGLTKIGE